MERLIEEYRRRWLEAFDKEWGRGNERLTDAEREAIEAALGFCERTDRPLPTTDQIATLRGLLERTKSDPG